jgi:hypothetical protein
LRTLSGAVIAIRLKSIEWAMREVEAAVRSEGNAKDIGYLVEHRARFAKTVERIRELAPFGARVLDVGSHYLHVSSALRLMDYEAVGARPRSVCGP